SLEDRADLRALLLDLCTPAELEAMSDRWRVVPLLLDGLPYREIHDRTAVSVTTIGRVARCLAQGAGGYRRAAQRLGLPAASAPHPASHSRCTCCTRCTRFPPSPFEIPPMKPRDRLRIATQKNGRLSEPGRELLARSGLNFRESRDRLFCYGESLPIDLLLVRDDDIPGLIADGNSDLGLVGRNVLEEQRLERAARGLPPALDRKST